MTETAGPTTDTLTTGSPAPNGGGMGAGIDVAQLQAQIAALNAQNAQLAKDLTEQRNIQAGLDRAITQKDSQITALTDSLNKLQTITTSDGQALETLRQQHAAVTAELDQLRGFQSEVESLRTQNSRMRLLMEKHPELSYLVANDAMPAAETEEEFIQKLDRIAGAGSSAATTQAQSMLSGSRPPAQPPAGQGNPNPDQLLRDGTNLIAAGKVEEGNKLIDQYWELRKAQS